MGTNSEAAEIQADLFYSGHRMTKVRKALIDVFTWRRQPLSIADLAVILKKRGLAPHKITLIRELDFLKEKHVIERVDLADEVERFEYVAWPHHHHVTCLKCKKIEDVELENDAEHLDKLVKTKNNFVITRHVLEFYGTCSDCIAV
jgi:Fur family ferric uptake transcriptional regulator